MNPTQDWLQLTIAAGSFNPEQLEDALLAVGALAVTYQDGGDQPVWSLLRARRRYGRTSA